MTGPTPKTQHLTAIGSGGLSVMSTRSDFTPNAEEESDWHVRLVELNPGEFHAICHLTISGSNSRAQSVVAAKLAWDYEPAKSGKQRSQALKDEFPTSYLNHGLYDTAASAVRVSLAQIASELKVDRITPAPRMEVVDHTQVSEEMQSPGNAEHL